MSDIFDKEVFYPEPARLPIHEQGGAKAYQLPPAADLAARLRDDMTLETLAAELGITADALARRLNKSGFRTTGRTIGEPPPRPAERLNLVYAPQDWMENSDCKEYPPDLWYSTAPGDRQIAINICGTCPVRAKCLTYALETEAGAHGLPEGVWGGMTPAQRARLLKGKAAA